MIKKWLDLNLRSISQVMLQNNPWTGLVLLIGIFWAAVSQNEIHLALGTLVGVFAANAMAFLLKFDQKSVEQGLGGYNGVLIGLAGVVLFKPSLIIYLLIILGSALSTFLLFKTPKSFPALTFPFICITWLIFVIVMVSAPEMMKSSPGKLELGYGVLKSFSQVFLINDWIAGALFIVALAIGSMRATVFAIMGAVIALVIATLEGADVGNVQAGLYGYSAILTAIALKESELNAILGVGIAIILQFAFGGLMKSLGIPILTAPFVLSVWIVLGCKAYFK